jgi:hypothetical protein
MVDGLIAATTVVDAQIIMNFKTKINFKIGCFKYWWKEYGQVLGAGLIGQQYFASWTINP